MSRTPAADSVLRLALGMMAADMRFVLPCELRQWIIDRLQQQTALSDAERQGVCEPLLAYIAAYHPRIADIVAKQFTAEGAGEGPQEAAAPQRPFHHYGLVTERTQE